MLCLLTGDVLQLPVPLRGVDLLPGAGAAPQGLLGWNQAHVHAQGNTLCTFTCCSLDMLIYKLSTLNVEQQTLHRSRCTHPFDPDPATNVIFLMSPSDLHVRMLESGISHWPTHGQVYITHCCSCMKTPSFKAKISILHTRPNFTIDTEKPHI